jgi:AcrR family transcriptional regulator
MDRKVTDDLEPRRLLRPGRPRSGVAHRAILDAARDLIVEGGFGQFRLEKVASRAGVGKATIYRRWRSKEALALDVLLELAAPHLVVPDVGDTRAELRACVTNASHALRDGAFGSVIKGLLSEIVLNPKLGDPFRASVVQARRDEVAAVVARGIERGDLRADADADLATELLVGPVYFRMMFGGDLSDDVADRIVAAVLGGFSAPRP